MTNQLVTKEDSKTDNSKNMSITNYRDFMPLELSIIVISSSTTDYTLHEQHNDVS